MDYNETVCHCVGVTIGDIKEAIDNGATTFEQVQEATQCSTGCGGCEDDVKGIINELLK